MFQQVYAGLLAQLAEMPVYLASVADRLPHEVLIQAPSCDPLPLVVHLWHVRDCESDLYCQRIRRVLSEDRPTLPGVDVSVWPEEREYIHRAAAQAVAEFEQLRSAFINEMKEVHAQSLARVGISLDGREINVLGILEQMAEHDRDHRYRIARILRALVVQ